MNHHPAPPRDPDAPIAGYPAQATEAEGYPAGLGPREVEEESEMQDRVEIVAVLDALENVDCDIPWTGPGSLFERAARVIRALDAAPREVTEGMVEAAYAAFKAYWSTVTNCYLSTADINLSAMRAALTAALGVETSLQKTQTITLRACAAAVVKAWNRMTPEQEPAEELWQPMHDLANALSGAADGKQSLPTEAGAADERETVEGWQPIASAPTDRPVHLFVAAYRDDPAFHHLPEFQRIAQYHMDAGWAADELRVATHWRPLPDPPIPTIAQGGER